MQKVYVIPKIARKPFSDPGEKQQNIMSPAEDSRLKWITNQNEEKEKCGARELDVSFLSLWRRESQGLITMVIAAGNRLTAMKGEELAKSAPGIGVEDGPRD